MRQRGQVTGQPPDRPTEPSPDATDWGRRPVVSQVYIRSFADGDGDGVGDIAGIRARLPYLRDLGIADRYEGGRILLREVALVGDVVPVDHRCDARGPPGCRGTLELGPVEPRRDAPRHEVRPGVHGAAASRARRAGGVGPRARHASGASGDPPDARPAGGPPPPPGGGAGS